MDETPKGYDRPITATEYEHLSLRGYWVNRRVKLLKQITGFHQNGLPCEIPAGAMGIIINKYKGFDAVFCFDYCEHCKRSLMITAYRISPNNLEEISQKSPQGLDSTDGPETGGGG